MKNKIRSSDINIVFIRSIFIQGSWNFERMQSLGFCFSILPIIKKLYCKDEKEKKKALKRHLEFFNTHPYMVSPILGIIIAMEEKKANGFNIKSSTINNIKVGLMGPLAGVGDPIFWGTIRPILSALGSSLSITGNILGPLIFFLIFNIIRLTYMYYSLFIGYKKGINIIEDISSNNNILKKVTEGSSILGLFVLGALVNKWTNINIPLIISKIEKTINITNIITLQNIFDQLIPGLIPLILTLICMWLLNKKINPFFIIISLFLISIVCNYFHFLTN